MSRLLLWKEEKLWRLIWLAKMSRLLLWEEEKLGKTHLGGQDAKALVMGGTEVREDSSGWPGCQGSCYGKRRSWGRLTWVARMSRLLL
jgi:hypothetical protein